MFFFASMNSRNKIQKLQKDLNDLEKPAGEKFFFRHFLLHERQKKKKENHFSAEICNNSL